MQRQPITLEGHQKLKIELKRLRQEELPNNVKAIAEARAHGDLSENAEFHAAKERQAVIAAKMAEIEEILANCQVVDPLPKPEGRVVFGATVTVFDVETEQEMVYQLVGQPESDPDNGRISFNSPIGKSLVGKEEGDEVKVKTPGGIRILEVVSVE